jgi:hypothetical protein
MIMNGEWLKISKEDIKVYVNVCSSYQPEKLRRNMKILGQDNR